MQTTIATSKVELFKSTVTGPGTSTREVTIKQPGGTVGFHARELNSLIALLTLLARNPDQDISMTLGEMGLDPNTKKKDKDED